MDYLYSFIGKFGMLADPVLVTIGVFLLYRAVRSRTALVMFIAQAAGALFEVYSFLMASVQTISNSSSHNESFQVAFLMNTGFNIVFYITFILVAIDIGKRLHPKYVRASG